MHDENITEYIIKTKTQLAYDDYNNVYIVGICLFYCLLLSLTKTNELLRSKKWQGQGQQHHDKYAFVIVY